MWDDCDGVRFRGVRMSWLNVHSDTTPCHGCTTSTTAGSTPRRHVEGRRGRLAAVVAAAAVDGCTSGSTSTETCERLGWSRGNGDMFGITTTPTSWNFARRGAPCFSSDSSSRRRLPTSLSATCPSRRPVGRDLRRLPRPSTAAKRTKRTVAGTGNSGVGGSVTNCNLDVDRIAAAAADCRTVEDKLRR